MQQKEIKYGNGEKEQVMTLKDTLLLMLILCIPIFNIYYLIKIAIKPTNRCNKTYTNYTRLSIILCAIVFVIGSIFSATLGMTAKNLINNATSSDESVSYDYDIDTDDMNLSQDDDTSDSSTKEDGDATADDVQSDGVEVTDTTDQTNLETGALLSNEDFVSITVGNMSLSIDGMGGWSVMSSDEHAISLQANSNYQCNYADSYIQTGDETAVQQWIDSHSVINDTDYTNATANTFEYGGNCYYVVCNADTFSTVYILQDIGSNNYLEITVDDYTNTLSPETIINTFCISFT